MADADLFAVGVMVVETLTGVRPFGGRTPPETIAALLHGSYRLPGDTAEMRALDAVVQRCLSKEPGHRHASAADLSMDLCPAPARCQGGAWSASPTAASPAVEDLTS